MLFPSPQGGLAITTTAGGGLFGTAPGGLTSLTMSDSADRQLSLHRRVHRPRAGAGASEQPHAGHAEHLR